MKVDPYVYLFYLRKALQIDDRDSPVIVGNAVSPPEFVTSSFPSWITISSGRFIGVGLVIGDFVIFDRSAVFTAYYFVPFIVGEPVGR